MQSAFPIVPLSAGSFHGNKLLATRPEHAPKRHEQQPSTPLITDRGYDCAPFLGSIGVLPPDRGKGDEVQVENGGNPAVHGGWRESYRPCGCSHKRCNTI